MTISITDWIKDDLIPSLFPHIPQLFPEHNFNKFTWGWGSKTYLDGTPHKDRKNKTAILKTAPAFIFEQGGERLSLVDYVMRRDRTDFIQAVKKLTEISGIQLPGNQEYDKLAYLKFKEQASILESCNAYFKWCLGHTPGKEADAVRTYLSQEATPMKRGKSWSLVTFQANRNFLHTYLTVRIKQALKKKKYRI
jgi:hypothetical protein